MLPNAGMEQKFRYDNERVSELHERSLEDASKALRNMEVFCGNDCRIGGLSGWVFEQTVQYCLQRELRDRDLHPQMAEQYSLGGKAKADLAVWCVTHHRVAIEIKLRGLFGPDEAERYRRYKEAANAKKLQYLYITKGETYRPYREGIQEALGVENTFFLDTEGDWERFVTRIVTHLQDLPGTITAP